MSFSVLFVCICLLHYCHRVATHLQLNISYHIISYHIISYHIISYHIISYIITLWCTDPRTLTKNHVPLSSTYTVPHIIVPVNGCGKCWNYSINISFLLTCNNRKTKTISRTFRPEYADTLGHAVYNEKHHGSCFRRRQQAPRLSACAGRTVITDTCKAASNNGHCTLAPHIFSYLFLLPLLQFAQNITL